MKKPGLSSLCSFYFLTLILICLDIAYLPLYAKHLGFNPRQISLVSAAYFVGNAFFIIPWSLFADTFQKSKSLIVFGIFLSTLFSVPLLWTKSVFWFTIVFYIYAILQVVIYPQAESLTIETGKKEDFQYGFVRGVGSTGFVIASLIFGFIIDWKGFIIIPILYIATTVFQFFSTLALPRISIKIETKPSIEDLKKFVIALIPFLIICILQQSSHGLYYGFFSIWLEENGYTPSVIGVFWMIAIASEVIALWQGHHLLKKIGAPWAILLSLVLTAVRWLLCYFSAYPIPVVISQMLNAASFGIFHLAALSYLNNHIPNGFQQTGIAIYMTAAFGIGSATGVLGFGQFISHFGIQPLFIIASILAFTGVVIFMPVVIRDRQLESNPTI